jgi:multidrug resistance efflux pump
LFEIDPADYKTALDSAKAAVANMEANLRQKQQDLERETELLQKMYLHDKNFRPRKMLSPPKWLNRPPPEQT